MKHGMIRREDFAVSYNYYIIYKDAQWRLRYGLHGKQRILG